MRRIVIAAVIFLVAVAAAVFFLLFSLDVIAKRTLEERGSLLTGTEVEVDSVTLRLAQGRGTLSDLRVGNPDGFSEAPALVLDDIELAIRARSVSESPFPLEEVRVGQTTVLLEIAENGSSNLDLIRRHASERSDRPTPPDEDEPVLLRIERLHFAGGEVLLLTSDRDEPERLTLPPFTLNDLGGAEGATGSEIGLRVLRELVRRAAVASAGHELGRALEKELGEAGRAAGELIRGIFD